MAFLRAEMDSVTCKRQKNMAFNVRVLAKQTLKCGLSSFFFFDLSFIQVATTVIFFLSRLGAILFHRSFSYLNQICTFLNH